MVAEGAPRRSPVNTKPCTPGTLLGAAPSTCRRLGGLANAMLSASKTKKVNIDTAVRRAVQPIANGMSSEPVAVLAELRGPRA